MSRSVKPPDRRSSRWEAHRAARRAALVATAVEAIDAHGPEVSLDLIAAQAGVTKPVLYRYFADKDELLAAVARWGAEQVFASVTRVLSADLTPREVVTQVIDSYLAEVEQHRNVFLVTVRHLGPAEEGPLADGRTAMAAVLSRALGDALREAGVDAGGAEPWAYALVGMALSTAEWWLERETMSRGALAEYLTLFVWHALDGISREHFSHSEAPIRLLRPETGGQP